MTAYVFVLLGISIVLLPIGKISLKGRVDVFCLALIAICYVGLISLALNVENTVGQADEHPGKAVTNWFGSNWLYVALLDVAVIALLHAVLIFVHLHRQKNRP